MNKFGGDWTKQKIEIVVSYAKAYLTVMKSRTYWKLLYFDGFAGSGDIYKENAVDATIMKGTALQILEITNPRPFDMYYFVEKDLVNKKDLETAVGSAPGVTVVADDCNKKLKDMAKFLQSPRGKDVKVLAFIDPYGMNLEWSSLKALEGLGIDLWVLVPTGMGVNRLLKKDGNISEAWLQRLETFLGMKRAEILRHFYREKTDLTLFGEEKIIEKDADAVNKAAELYRQRLNEIFKFVSTPFVMKNSSNSVMYHFMMATNNATALKIANDVIKPRYT